MSTGLILVVFMGIIIVFSMGLGALVSTAIDATMIDDDNK